METRRYPSVSDLREPLDYAMVAVGERFDAEKAELLCLPIEDTEHAFEREMKKRKIEKRCPQLAVFFARSSHIRDLRTYL